MVLPRIFEPPPNDRHEWRGVDVVEFVSTLTAGLDEAGGFEDIEVLRDRLSRRPEAVFGRQARADLEQRLPAALGQFVEDGATGGIGQGLEDVSHAMTLGKWRLACQGFRPRWTQCREADRRSMMGAWSRPAWIGGCGRYG
jgi:hypothetical protein